MSARCEVYLAGMDSSFEAQVSADRVVSLIEEGRDWLAIPCRGGWDDDGAAAWERTVLMRASEIAVVAPLPRDEDPGG